MRLAPSNANSRRRGLTLVEVLVILAIVGVLAGISVIGLRRPDVRSAANGLRAQLQQARLEAVKTNRPVAVVYDSVNDRFESAVFGSATLASCAVATTTVFETLHMADFAQVTATTTMVGGGIVWLPSGLARDCNEGGSIASQTTFTNGRVTAIVDVSTGGRVEIQ